MFGPVRVFSLLIVRLNQTLVRLDCVNGDGVKGGSGDTGGDGSIQS